MSNTIDLSRSLVRPPDVPSKYDIIPIHTSDRGTFKFCRRQWGWSSPSKLNLIPKTRIHGVRTALWFGTGIHYALERSYNPILREDPVVSWQSWFDLQWNGGLVTEEEIKEHGFYDRDPEYATSVNDAPRSSLDLDPKHDGVYYRVKGLAELLPDPDPDIFNEFRDLGTGMMEFYKTYCEREDNFSVISVEHTFSVPILDDNGKVMYAVDDRIMPDSWEPDFSAENAYGPLIREAVRPKGDFGADIVIGIEKQVHARGRMDAIIQDNETGRFGIIDHKTAATIGEDYFRHLDLDEQCTTYIWAAEQEAKLHGLEYEQLDFVIYQALLKAYPKPPTITTRGFPSINRADESTTAQMYAEAIDKLGIRMIFDQDEKWQSYYTWLVETGDKRFVHREVVRRNKIQKFSCGRRLYYEACDMLGNPKLYPNPTKNYQCLNCIFRQPCISVEDGGDYQFMLDNNYQSNWDR